MNDAFTILHVEDNPGDVALLEELVPAEEFSFEHVETLAAACEALEHKGYDLVLLDLGLPDTTGTSGVAEISARFPGVALVVLTGLDSDDVALRAVREGAQDYLTKGKIEVGRMARVLRNAIARKEIEYHKQLFMANISHELSNPLNAVLGYAELLAEELNGPLNDAQRRSVSQIIAGSRRLVALVGDLLDSAQVLSGQFRVEREPTQLSRVITSAVAELTPLADEKQIALHLDEVVPATLELDPRRICQVMTNLLSNAIKYTPAGGQVRIRSRVSAGWARTEVSDTGIGVSEEFLPQLFGRYTRQAPLPGQRRPKGLGLGLNISKAIVEAHGGEIGVTRNPDVGSTFWFTLPVGPPG